MSKRYSSEFKSEAVDLLRTSGKPSSRVAVELGITPNTLRAWKRKLLSENLDSAGGNVNVSTEDLFEENRRLRRENEYLKRQREILKKAALILGDSSQNHISS